jgi:hypothetical protein
MKYLALATLFLGLVNANIDEDIQYDAPLDKRGCQANNCVRAVTGTQRKAPGTAARMADCTSFQQTTYYTCLVAGVTVATSSPTAVPTYASDCTSPIAAQTAYGSACSCWGNPPTTTVVPTIIFPF